MDKQAVYFIASTSTAAPLDALWQISPDGTNGPVSLGPAGPRLAQDEGHLYFASQDKTILYSAAKSSSDVRETIYTAPAGDMIELLTANSKSLFIVLNTGMPNWDVVAIDKRTLEQTALPRQSQSGQSYDNVFELVADDSYCYVQNSQYRFRYDIASSLLNTIPVPDGVPVPIGSRLLVVSDHNGAQPGPSVLSVDPVTGDTVTVHTFGPISVTWSDQIAVSGAGLFVSSIDRRLVRVLLPPP